MSGDPRGTWNDHLGWVNWPEVTGRRVDDGDPFNAGWNAGLDDAEKKVRALPTDGVAADGVQVLISKAQVLAILRGR